MPFSDYIVYIDESGDHGLEKFNPQNPVFALSFCIFQKTVYRTIAVPSVQKLKFDFWGHDAIVFHSHGIRNRRGYFHILNDQALRQAFFEDINNMIAELPFTLLATTIDKYRLRQQYVHPANPYAIGLEFCIERLQYFLSEHDQIKATTLLMVECRGKKEDNALELEFRRICSSGTFAGPITNLDLRFIDKKQDSAGLQIADLVAYPIARYTLDPRKPNRAYDVVSRKFRRSASGQEFGIGLKSFP